jgi:hypothetical protein
MDTKILATYKSVFVPLNTGLLVGVGVGVTLGRTGLTAEKTVQVGADLVGTASLDGVALGATGLEMRSVLFSASQKVDATHLEELGTLGSVT